MNRTSDSLGGRAALIACHCAGMMDIVALPVWVGTVLMGFYRWSPQQAGGLVTVFLAAVVISSLFFAPRFNRLRADRAAPLGFALAAAAFFGMSQVQAYGAMLGLHGLGGLAVGCGLSFAHGTMGRSANPHRLMAIGFTALSTVAVVFFAVVPPLVARAGGPMLFLIMGGFMALAAVLAALAFPRVEVATAAAPQSTDRRPLGASVWFAMVGFGLMALNQSLMFSFLERIGFFRGFDQAQVLGLLVALGLVNLLPAPLAGLLQRRLRPERVMVAGPLLQLALALVITQSTVFLPYAVAACVYIGVLTFTHTFTFGFLAHSDPTGRAVAATPVMTMTGSAIGPVVGGMVVQNLGYPVIGIAAALVALVSFTCFVRSSQSAESAGLAIGRPEAT